MSMAKRIDDQDARRKLGERLREARCYLGLKQEEAARVLKIQRSALSEMEAGNRRVEALEFNRLAKLYRQPVAFFSGEDDAAAGLPVDVAHPTHRAAGLSRRDRDEPGRFADYLRARSEAAQEKRMVSEYVRADRHGAAAAERLHRDLGVRERLEGEGGSINVFALIDELNVPLLLRPLDGLLGVYLNIPAPGILVATERQLSIQRFTAAHELGHCILEHQPSLDDEDSIFRRMPITSEPGNQDQEVEANAFAVGFMMPEWLLALHMRRQGWVAGDLHRPDIVYQLGLRLGSSYEAMCWTLARYRMIATQLAHHLLLTRPETLKEVLLADHRPQDHRGDVWLLTERDAGARIDGSRDDLFVLKLTEHSNGGYLWNIDDLRDSGFAIVRNEVDAVEPDSVGDPGVRRITARPPNDYRGRVVLDEARPWDSSLSLKTLELELDFTGPEEAGLSRAERRRMLEAA